MADLQAIARALEAKPKAGGGFMARCPAHKDGSPSLSLDEHEGTLLARCFAGCTWEAIRAALEARGLDLGGGRQERPETVWTIRDAAGRALAQHVRVDKPEGKAVFWRGPEGEKRKLVELGLRLADLPPYGSELLASRPAEPVVICEGEKAADAARRLGLLALGTSTGASAAPSPAALEPLQGREVILWPDNDADGSRHMERLAANLRGIASSVRTIRWAEAPPKGDAADYLARGLGRADFDALVASAAAGEASAPTSASTPKASRLRLRYLGDAAAAALDELDRFSRGDFSRYVPTGLPSLDRALGGGLRRGYLALLGAPTGAGKTTVLGQLGVSAAEAGHAVLIVTPEMPAEELAARELIRRSGQGKFTRAPWRSGPNSDFAQQAHERAAEELQAARLPIVVLDEPASMDAIEAHAREVKAQHPELALVALDYAQILTGDDPRTPRYLAVGNVGSRAVALARALDVAVVLASQINPPPKGKGSDEGDSPTFRESAILSHNAGTVLLFSVEWRTDQRTNNRVVDRAAFRALKSRGGGLFEVPVKYEPGLFRVTELADPMPSPAPGPRRVPDPEVPLWR